MINYLSDTFTKRRAVKPKLHIFNQQVRVRECCSMNQTLSYSSSYMANIHMQALASILKRRHDMPPGVSVISRYKPF